MNLDDFRDASGLFPHVHVGKPNAIDGKVDSRTHLFEFNAWRAGPRFFENNIKDTEKNLVRSGSHRDDVFETVQANLFQGAATVKVQQQTLERFNFFIGVKSLAAKNKERFLTNATAR